MRSAIPIFGFPHKINVVRWADADDGAGGIAPAPSTVFTNLTARISDMTDEDKQTYFGNMSGENFKVLVDGSPSIDKSDMVELSSSSIEAPIPTGKQYRVLYLKKQIDHNGGIHHLSLVVELEDVDAS